MPDSTTLTPQSGPSIEVGEVRFAYGDHHALAGISFQVEPGEVLGLLGPNGAGKSTTIKLLTGQLEPSAGWIRLLGQDACQQRDGIQAEIGVTFEQQNLYEDMTPVENLDFFAGLFGIEGFDALVLLERVGLADRATARVAALSKGLRQRLMIARSLVNQPRILLLDEPTSGLDPVSSRSIKEIVREEAARGAAILLTTHDMQVADELSDRVAFLHQGQILAMDTPEKLKLAHRERTLRVRYASGGEILESVIPLSDQDIGQQVNAAIGKGDLLTVHTDEASLEEVFVSFAGRGLQG